MRTRAARIGTPAASGSRTSTARLFRRADCRGRVAATPQLGCGYIPSSGAEAGGRGYSAGTESRRRRGSVETGARLRYYGRRWRGRESDVVWAANELKSKGFVTLRNVVPVEEVAALRDKAEDSWCAIARALHAKNLSHCLVWKLRHAEVGGKELAQPFGAYKDARKCAWHAKFTKERGGRAASRSSSASVEKGRASRTPRTRRYVVHEPGALGSMEQAPTRAVDVAAPSRCAARS